MEKTHPITAFLAYLGSERRGGFDPEGEGYDYETARAAGLGPDETGHWPSRHPRTGQLLKGRRHPTWPLTEQGELEAGYEIQKDIGGFYMSRPKKGMLPVDAVEDRARALDLRKKIANTQDAQFINKVFQFTPKQRDAYAAIEALQNLREQEAEMFDERARRPRGMLPVPPSQADVRRLDNAQVDRWGRTEAGPDADYFGDHRDTFHAQTQQHIDHISARAHHAAEILKKRGTLKGSGYETAAKDFDDWFGPGSFKEHYLGR